MHLGTSAGTLRWMIVGESDVLNWLLVRQDLHGFRDTEPSISKTPHCNHATTKLTFLQDAYAYDPMRAASIPRSLGKQIALLCLFNSTQEKATLFIIDKSDLHNKIISYRCTCCHHFQFHSTKKRCCWSRDLKLVEFGIDASRHRGLAIVNYQSSGTTINRQPPKHQQQILFRDGFNQPVYHIFTKSWIFPISLFIKTVSSSLGLNQLIANTNNQHPIQLSQTQNKSCGSDYLPDGLQYEQTSNLK